MEDEEWYPHPGPQRAFCTRPEFEVFFGGAKGPGKTDCLIAEALRGVGHKWYKGLILRRTFPRLQEIIDRCWNIYPKVGGEYRSSTHRWMFPSGAIITLGHVQHEDSKRDYHGKEFNFVGFDELTEFTETQYLFILANVRKSKDGLPLRIRATSNPGNKGHLWVKNRFVDTCQPKRKVKYKGPDGEYHEMFLPETYIDPITGTSRCFVPATVYDNPSIMVHDPLYVKRLEGLPQIDRLRFLHGVWDVFEGQVFTELSDHLHGCDKFEIPAEWTKFMSFDWGYSRPWGAFWWALDFDNVLYLYRAYYGMTDGDPNKGTRMTNTQIARKIRRIDEQENIKFRVADPACWSPTKIKGSNQVHGPSFVEDAAREKLYFLKADNDRLRGKQQVHQRFMLDEEIDEETGEVTERRPRFVAFRTDEYGKQGVSRWWNEMQALYEDPKNPEDVDTDQPDEGYDCTRYAFMARPIKPRKQVLVPPGSFQAERKRLIRAKNYARRHGVSLGVAYSRIR